MSAVRARGRTTESITYSGHRVDVLPSTATRPLLGGPLAHPMTWELRAPENDELYGYIRDNGAGDFCAFDPVAFEFGLGVACTTREAAIAALLGIAFAGESSTP